MTSTSGATRPAYDLIADLYDVDMARNMAFDDVGYYARVCGGVRGRVLELGCGNGRITLALAARGIDVVGVDGAQRMLEGLRAKAAAKGLARPPPLARMDVRALAFRPASFDVVLCPYSLVTYMSGEGDAARMIGEARDVLVDGGSVVVDAFVPRTAAMSDTFRQDYARPLPGGNGTLVRSKRVTPVSASTHRIERRYDVLDASGALARRIATDEVIRPFTPDQVVALVEAAGLRARATAWDYDEAGAHEGAQFFTVVAAAA